MQQKKNKIKIIITILNQWWMIPNLEKKEVQTKVQKIILKKMSKQKNKKNRIKKIKKKRKNKNKSNKYLSCIINHR